MNKTSLEHFKVETKLHCSFCAIALESFWNVFRLYRPLFGILKQFQFFRLKSWQEVNWWHHFQFVMTSSNICHWSVNYTSVMWPSQRRCQSSSFHNGHPRYKFQVYKVSRSWDTIGERVCVYNPFHTASHYSRGRCTLEVLSNLLL